VDLYIGGLEHAVLHLLYARFWHKVLYDCGVVSTKEPFKKLVNQGMILGDNNEKMSKSRGNVVNPDDVIAQWGADSMRLYSMFMGPLEAAKPWQTNGIAGVNRFVKRFWRLAIGEDGKINTRVSDKPDSDELRKAFHKTVKKVTDDTETMQFNTGIAAMMEFINAAYKVEHINKETVEKFTIMLAPYAPHVAEEVWEKLGNTESITYQSWPTYDPAQCVEDSVTISVQVNGKLRGTLALPKGAAKEDALGQAKAIGSVQKHLEGKTIRKEIFVPNKIINFVVG
jgi:leucyl-tRNA synthetase